MRQVGVPMDPPPSPRAPRCLPGASVLLELDSLPPTCHKPGSVISTPRDSRVEFHLYTRELPYLLPASGLCYHNELQPTGLTLLKFLRWLPRAQEKAPAPGQALCVRPPPPCSLLSCSAVLRESERLLLPSPSPRSGVPSALGGLPSHLSCESLLRVSFSTLRLG